MAHRATGANFQSSYNLSRLAQAHVQAGHFDRAAELADQAIGEVERTGERWWQAEALRMITSVAAEVIGLGHRKGRIAPGFDADILAVDGDPIADPAALHRIRGVYARGTAVPEAGTAQPAA